MKYQAIIMKSLAFSRMGKGCDMHLRIEVAKGTVSMVVIANFSESAKKLNINSVVCRFNCWFWHRWYSEHAKISTSAATGTEIPPLAFSTRFVK